MNHDKISIRLEAICNRGCTEVNDIIDAMEHGTFLNEIADLSNQEKDTLLDELKKIMSVYNKKSP